MSHQQIVDIKEEWSDCTKCNLHETRGEHHVCLGRGSVPCTLLVVIPSPRFNTPECPTPYEAASPEMSMMNAIADKVGIDTQRMHITNAVSCIMPEGHYASKVNLEACRPKLVQLTQVLKPKAVMLLGPEALYSWFGDTVETSKRGLVDNDVHRHVMFSYDFTRYLEAKKHGKERDMAKEIFEHWEIIRHKILKE